MNMTPKGFLFFTEDGECQEVLAASLAEATSKLPDDFSYETYEMHYLYQVAKMSQEGTWDILGSYFEEEDAEAMLDEYGDQYPNAYLDILYNGKVQ